MLSLVAASGYVLNAPAPIASRVRAVSMDAAKMECAAAAATAFLHPSPQPHACSLKRVNFFEFLGSAGVLE